MAQGQLSIKRIGVDKANGRIVAITAGAAFLVVFFLVASVSLFSQLTYQNRIIKEKKKAVTQLESNIKARDNLSASYKTFAAAGQNMIQGSSVGVGPRDGSNPKITLDALPSTYDFPALTASLEKVAAEQQVTIENITGTDDEVAQAAAEVATKPVPVEMPFEIEIQGGYGAAQSVVEAFDRSIRPIQVQKLEITGEDGNVKLTIAARTYYQPTTTLNITTKVVK